MTKRANDNQQRIFKGVNTGEDGTLASPSGENSGVFSIYGGISGQGLFKENSENDNICCERRVDLRKESVYLCYV